jgi:hypothetical protein
MVNDVTGAGTVTRKIYVNRDNVADLSAPTNWVFVDCETDEVIE